MDILDKIDALMVRYDLNKHTLSEKSGIPYMTITSFYKSGYKNAKLSTVFRLAEFFNVPVDYLLLDQYSSPQEYYLSRGPYNLSELELELITGFLSLNKDGKAFVMSCLDAARNNPKMTETAPPSAESESAM